MSARPGEHELRVLIVDDEAPARQKLRRYLSGEPNARVVAEADAGDRAVAAIREWAPDIVLLDIQMPGLDGFGVVEAVGVEAMPEVIFVTAHDEHALRAFDVHALDYLLKPVAPGRFRASFDRARRRVEDRRDGVAAADVAQRLVELLRGRNSTSDYLQRVLVEDGKAALFLPVDRIDRIEAERNYARLHAGRHTYVLRSTISALADRLDPAVFLRVNRSTLVRLDAIRAVHPWSHGDHRIVLSDGTTVTWSRRYRALTGSRFGVV